MASPLPGLVKQKFSEALAALSERTRGKGMTVEQLEASLQGRGLAMLIMLLCIPFILPVPLMGLSTIMGIALAVLGLRLSMGLGSWLPRRLREHELSPRTLESWVHHGQRLARRLEVWLRARHVGPWLLWRVLGGLAIVASGAVLSLPLPIPFSNAIPAFAIILAAAGLMERDAVFIVLSFVVLALGGIYILTLGELVAQTAVSIWQATF